MNLNNKIKFFLGKLLYKIFKKIKNKIFISSELSGDRNIEWSFAAVNIGSGPGRALDFGCGSSYLGLIAAEAGYRVISLDLEPQDWFYRHPNLQFRQGDILKIDFPGKSFDLIINCSSIEHVGLAGRYGVKENRPDGDIKVMTRMRSILKPNGRMLLTIPVGKDAVFPPLHRVYGQHRLPRLLEGYTVVKKEYWIKNNQNKWIQVEESIALNKAPNQNLYGLGCFVLRSKN